MGLFTKKPINTSTNQPLYNIASKKILLIVGLGNPDTKYTGTRHNIGFDCIDYFVSSHPEFSKWTEKKGLNFLWASGNFDDKQVIAIKPTTYMNNSGQAVATAKKYYKMENNTILVIHDDLDIDFGAIRTRAGGSSAGHNGIKSILKHLSDFYRLRIGIRNNQINSSEAKDFVLKKFSSEEKKHLSALKREVDSILIEYIYQHDLNPDTRHFVI